MEKLKSDSLEELDLPAYIHNILVEQGITTISVLLDQSKYGRKSNEKKSYYIYKYFKLLSKKLKVFGIQLDQNIENLDLSTRTFRTLYQRGFCCISHLIKMETTDLKKIYGLGSKSVEEIIEKVHSLGLKFADEPKDEEFITPIDIIDPINTQISEQMKQSKLEKLARIQELQKQIIALQQEQSQLMQELQEEISKGDTNARQNR